MASDVDTLLRDLRRHGYEAVLAGGGHYILKDKNGVTVRTDKGVAISISATPSDSRWRDNVLATLRKVGIDPTAPPPARKAPGTPDEEILLLNALRQRVEWALARAESIKDFIDRGAQHCESVGVKWFGDTNSAYHAISSLRSGKRIRGQTVKRLEMACEAFAPVRTEPEVEEVLPMIPAEIPETAPVRVKLLEIAELVYTGLPLDQGWRDRAHEALDAIAEILGEDPVQ